jgi:hypothetical protein
VEVLAALQRRRDDPSAVVRETVGWALRNAGTAATADMLQRPA